MNSQGNKDGKSHQEIEMAQMQEQIMPDNIAFLEQMLRDHAPNNTLEQREVALRSNIRGNAQGLKI